MNHRKGVTPKLAHFALLASAAIGLSTGCGEEVIATYEEVFDATDVKELVADFEGKGELTVEGQRDRTDVEVRAELIGWGPRSFHHGAADSVRIGGPNRTPTHPASSPNSAETIGTTATTGSTFDCASRPTRATWRSATSWAPSASGTSRGTSTS